MIQLRRTQLKGRLIGIEKIGVLADVVEVFLWYPILISHGR